MVKLLTLDLGFDRSNVLLVNANVHVAHILPPARTAIYDQIEDRLRSLPGVVSVGRSFRVPISRGEWNQNIAVDTPNAPKGEDSLAYFNFVSPRIFPYVAHAAACRTQL
jgi:hypothetical protein